MKKQKVLLKHFVNNKCIINITWTTGNIRSLFQIKDNMKHYSCIINKDNCSCGKNHVDECARNVILKWNEYEDPNEQSETAEYLTIALNGKYLRGHLNRAHALQGNWKDIKEKLSQTFFMKSLSPSLNN